MNIEERNQYLESNLGLCYCMAKIYSQKYRMDFQEMLSSCFEGAIEALDKGNRNKYSEAELKSYMLGGMRYKCFTDVRRHYRLKNIETTLIELNKKEQGYDYRRNKKNDS